MATDPVKEAQRVLWFAQLDVMVIQRDPNASGPLTEHEANYARACYACGESAEVTATEIADCRRLANERAIADKLKRCKQSIEQLQNQTMACTFEAAMWEHKLANLPARLTDEQEREIAGGKS